MGEPDLSFIKSDIKLEQTAPLNRRRVVALFNCYLMRMADFLNDFVQRAERLILEAERKLYVADTRLRILESKLSLVPESSPDSICAKIEQNITSASQEDYHKDQSVSGSKAWLVETPATVKTKCTEPQNKQELVVDETIPTTSQSVLLVKDDPSLAKYFKMLKMGVVEQAVKLKMISEGVNPLLLDTPNSPSPGAVHSVDDMPTGDKLIGNNSSDSISSFSDSD